MLAIYLTTSATRHRLSNRTDLPRIIIRLFGVHSFSSQSPHPAPLKSPSNSEAIMTKTCFNYTENIAEISKELTNGNSLYAKAIFICLPSSHPFVEKEVYLNGKIKIGRTYMSAKQCRDKLFFDSKVLSKSHALIWYDNGKVRSCVFFSKERAALLTCFLLLPNSSSSKTPKARTAPS